MAKMTVRQTFDEIYRENRWNGTDSRSNGPGGTVYARRFVAPAIADLVSNLGVTSVLDVGCGETYWQPELPGYIGIDVSSVAIEAAKERHPDWDIRLWSPNDELPVAEFVILRHVLQHMTPSSGKTLVERIKDMGAAYLAATTYDNGDNGAGFERPIVEGGGYWPDLRVEPFGLGEPSVSIEDAANPRPKQMGGRLGVWTLL